MKNVQIYRAEISKNGGAPDVHITFACKDELEMYDKAILMLQVANQLDSGYNKVRIVRTDGHSNSWVVELTESYNIQLKETKKNG